MHEAKGGGGSVDISPTDSMRPAHPIRLIALAVLPLFLAIWAQWALVEEQLAHDGIVLFAFAIAAFIASGIAGQRLQPRADRDVGARPALPVRWLSAATPLAFAAGFSALTWMYSSDNRFRLETILFWALAMGFYLVAFWDRTPGTSSSLISGLPRLSRESVAVPWSMVGLALVIAIAAFFRFYQIASIPAEMTSDHAEKLLDVRDVMNGEHRIFFPRNTGREPLQFYMAVPFVWLVGLNHLALKLVSATVSLATVPVVYLIGREISGARLGLLAAGLLAISKWDVAIGRIGLRFPFYPFFTALAFYFLFRALRDGRRNDYLLCGLATGAGLYGYSPFRAILIVIAGALAIKAFFEVRHGFRPILGLVRGGALTFGAATIVSIPLARYMTDDPQTFWFRTLTRVAEVERPIETNPVAVLAGNLVNGLAMFNWRGDVVWVNTIPRDPALDYVTGGLFVLGAAWCVNSLVKYREPVAAYLIFGLLASMLPSVLSVAFPGENPSVARAGAAGVFAVLLAAVPLHLTAQRIRAAWPTQLGTLLVGVVIGLVFLLAGRASYERYFVDYDRQYRQSAINTTEIARVITGFSDSVGSSENVYIKSWPHWVDARSVAFVIGRPEWNNVIMTNEELVSHAPPKGNRLYILNKDDMEGARLLEQRFPGGKLRVQSSDVAGREFLLFFVPDPL